MELLNKLLLSNSRRHDSCVIAKEESRDAGHDATEQNQRQTHCTELVL